MSKFKLSYIYLLSFLFLSFLLISFVLAKSSEKSLSNMQVIEKETMNKKTIIQAKKQQSKKTIIATNQEESFSCFVDQSILSIILSKKNIETKELLFNLKGMIAFKELSQIMFFKGKEGSIDYKNLALSIQNCLFYMQDKNLPIRKNIYEDTLFNSGMKSISISLKNSNFHHNF